MRMVEAQDGSEIYYSVYGHGKPIVLIHGNFQHHRFFKRQIAFFSRYYRVIAMDTRDQGKSTNKSALLNYELIIADLAQILKVEHIERCAIVGFSDGANIALAYACTFPNKVTKLVLCSGNLTFDGLYPMKQRSLQIVDFVFERLLRWKRGHRILRFSMLPVPVTTESIRLLVHTEALVVVGEQDIIKQDHTNQIVRMLPNVKYHTILNRGHTIRTVDAEMIVTFLERSELGGATT